MKRVIVVAIQVPVEVLQVGQCFRAILPRLKAVPARALSAPSERDALEAAQDHVRAWVQPWSEPRADRKTQAAGRDEI